MQPAEVGMNSPENVEPEVSYEMPGGIDQTTISVRDFYDKLVEAAPPDPGPMRHRVIEIDATDRQLEMLIRSLKAYGIHGVVRKPSY